MKTNQRLTPDKANWLAQHWAAPDASSDSAPGAEGQWRILGDAAHKVINPYISRVEEILEIYKSISAPTLFIEASDDSLSGWWKGRFTLAEFHERLKSVPNLQKGLVPDAGHMLHHDQPQVLADMLEAFLQP
jgi:pimeloyl-ACP methyl ester carboxylesterase